MPRIHFHKPGASPGALVANQDDANPNPPPQPAKITLIRYDRASVEQNEVSNLDVTGGLEENDKITWLHLHGSPAPEQLEHLRDCHELHPLALEDILHGERRPKCENFESQYFVILNYLYRGDDGLCVEPVYFFAGKNYVISIHTGTRGLFEPLRKRLHSDRFALSRGSDYLLYALMDVVVDAGFPLLEGLGDRLEDLEEEILEDPGHEARNRIHYVKRELVSMRRAWWPQREVISRLIRDGEGFFSENTRVYMRDCYDHSVIMIDFVETYREIAASLRDIYLSAVSQRMNDIMKTLTIIATIFLPLTTIAGIYGMNFAGGPWNMPELRWRYGYFYALGVMIAVGIGMLALFRRRRWL